jgi:hypothetical protein
MSSSEEPKNLVDRRRRDSIHELVEGVKRADAAGADAAVVHLSSASPQVL